MIRNVFLFERDQYYHSGKLIVPYFMLAGFMGFSYTISPQFVLDSFSVCQLVLFMVMGYVGAVQSGVENRMIEQAVYVKVPNKASFYIGKILVMAHFSLVFSIASVIVPVAVDLANGRHFFMRPLLPADLLSAFALFFLTSLCGGCLGLFANDRIFGKRETAVLAVVLVGLLSIVKLGLNDQIAFARYFTWLLPPVADLSKVYSREEFFSLSQTAPYFLWMAGYAAALGALYVVVMKKRKFV